MTHRFTRPLGRGDFGDLLSDFFGFDSGAQIGLELRYGLARGTQVGIYRTSDRTIEIFGQHSLLQQHDGMPVGIDVLGTFEGANNLQGDLSPAVGAIVSRKVCEYAALYAEPIVVFNTNPLDSSLVRQQRHVHARSGRAPADSAVDLHRRRIHAAASPATRRASA